METINQPTSKSVQPQFRTLLISILTQEPHYYHNCHQVKKADARDYKQPKLGDWGRWSDWEISSPPTATLSPNKNSKPGSSCQNHFMHNNII